MVYSMCNYFNSRPEQFRPAVGLFFQIKDAEGKEKGHLLGTFHLRTPSLSLDFNKKMFVLPNRITALLIEQDPSKMDKETEKKFVALTRLVSLLYLYLLGNLEEGMEAAFLKRMGWLSSYLGKKHEVVCLEEWEIQLRQINSEKSDPQAPTIESDFKLMHSGALQAASLFTHWREGNMEALHKVFESTSPANYIRILNERNRGMAEKICDFLLKDTGSPLIAIGAFHLGGNEGVIELLKRKGYTCEQIKPDIPDSAPKEYPVIEPPPLHQALFSTLMTDCGLTLTIAFQVRFLLGANTPDE